MEDDWKAAGRRLEGGIERGIMFKRILVPLDGSQMAEAVLPYVRSLVEPQSAEVFLVQINEALRQYYFPETAAMLEPVSEEMRAQARNYLNQTATALNDRGIRAHAELVEAVDVADSLLNYAAQKQVDLIAMSTHGRSGLGRWLLGSVADKVIHNAKVPVLLIRPDLSEQK